MVRSILVALAAVSGALAASQTIQVGQGTNFVFSPDTVTASAGDTIVFNFGSSTLPHSATQSTFDNPCTKSSNSSAFDSGQKSSGTFTYTVQDTNPVWIYCSVPGHCQAGMVAAINPPTSGSETFSAFQSKAKGGSGGSSSSGVSSQSQSSTKSGSTITSGGTSSSTASTSSSSSTSSKKNAAGRSVSALPLGVVGTVGTVVTLIGSAVFGASML